jgi:LytS/YehU family sensor histidine kinase
MEEEERKDFFNTLEEHGKTVRNQAILYAGFMIFCICGGLAAVLFGTKLGDGIAVTFGVIGLIVGGIMVVLIWLDG